MKRLCLGLVTVMTAAALGLAACEDESARPSGAGGEGGAEDGGGSGTSGTSGTGGSRAGSGGAGAGNGGGGNAGERNGGEAGAGGTDATAGAAGGGGAEGGEAGEGGAEPRGPLLDRPAVIEYDCTLTRPMALLGLNPASGGALLPSATGGYLARVEGDLGRGARVAWSSIGFSGALGAARPVYTAAQTLPVELTAVAANDRFTLLWSQSSLTATAQLMRAQVNAAGTVLTPAAPLALGTGERRSPQIATAQDGYVVVWTDLGEATSVLRFARLDSAGTVQGTARSVLQRPGFVQAYNVTPLGDRFLVTYAHVDWNGGTRGTYYAVLDASGAVRVGPTELGSGYGGSSVLARQSDVLVAWSEEGGSLDEERVHRTLSVASIDASGQLGEVHPVQAPVVHEENVDPRWVAVGDDVGLLWSRGSVIYICAGCFPDNVLEFVIFDGQDFTRRSNVVRLASPTQFGLRRPHALHAERDVLVVADVTHHVDAEAASATIRCSP